MNAPREQLEHDVPEALPRPFTPTRWGPRSTDPRTPEQRRADFAREVNEQRLRIVAHGFIETPAGPLKVPVRLESR